MPIFVCIALIRAVNDAGGISIYQMLLKVQEIDFDIQGIQDIIEFFKNGSFESGFAKWNDNLTGFDGFVTNFKNIFVSFFTMMGNLIKVFAVGLWRIFVEFFKLLGKLFDLVLYVTGFRQ